jgi:hypothetical protein
MLEDLKYLLWLFGFVILLAAPGLIGWFIADRLWKQGELGASIPYAVGFAGLLIYGLSDLRIRAVFIRCAGY